MFETFSKHHSTAEGQPMAAPMLVPEGSKLLCACRVGWPLQELSFRVIEGAPRRLSCLEDILLHIYRAIADDPPDSQTIAHELAIEDAFFVDQTLGVLTALGLLEKNNAGRLHVTDLGGECHSRGQIPGKVRERTISIVFDPIGHDFPDVPAASCNSQGLAESRGISPIGLPCQPVEARRIGLETLRKAATRQGLLPKDESRTIFTAEPAEGEPRLSHREVHLYGFINGQAQLSIQVEDAEDPLATRWFQRVIDSKLKEGQVGPDHLLGSLAIEHKAQIRPMETVGSSLDIDLSCLDLVPAHMVKEMVLGLVGKARHGLVIQSRSAGNNGHAKPLFEAVRTAAERGVDCNLLWDGGLADPVTRWQRDILCHQNIRHRKTAPVTQEILVSDFDVLLASWPSEIAIRGSDLKATVPVTGKTSNALTCQRIAETLAQRWDRAEPLDGGEDKIVALQNKAGSQHRTKQPSDPSRNVIRVNQTDTLQTLKEAI